MLDFREILICIFILIIFKLGDYIYKKFIVMRIFISYKKIGVWFEEINKSFFLFFLNCKIVDKCDIVWGECLSSSD